MIALADCWGNHQATNSYDEYGIPGSTNQGRFQYTGQAWIPELGMYHYKNRTYSPTLGRFLQTDPIGYGDGLNTYAYTHNDPVNFTDPLGLSGLKVCTEINIPGPGGEWIGTNVWICDIDRGFDLFAARVTFDWDGSSESIERGQNLCAKAQADSPDPDDGTIAAEDGVFEKIGFAADAAVTVGYLVAPINPAVGGVLITGGKVAGAVVAGVQGSAAIADAYKNGNYGRILSFGAGQAAALVGGRYGAKLGGKIFGNQQIRNAAGQFAGKRSNGVKQVGQTVGNSLGSKVCPN